MAVELPGDRRGKQAKRRGRQEARPPGCGRQPRYVESVLLRSGDGSIARRRAGAVRATSRFDLELTTTRPADGQSQVFNGDWFAAKGLANQPADVAAGKRLTIQSKSGAVEKGQAADALQTQFKAPAVAQAPPPPQVVFQAEAGGKGAKSSEAQSSGKQRVLKGDKANTRQGQAGPGPVSGGLAGAGGSATPGWRRRAPRALHFGRHRRFWRRPGCRSARVGSGPHNRRRRRPCPPA